MSPGLMGGRVTRLGQVWPLNFICLLTFPTSEALEAGACLGRASKLGFAVRWPCVRSEESLAQSPLRRAPGPRMPRTAAPSPRPALSRPWQEGRGSGGRVPRPDCWGRIRAGRRRGRGHRHGLLSSACSPPPRGKFPCGRHHFLLSRTEWAPETPEWHWLAPAPPPQGCPQQGPWWQAWGGAEPGRWRRVLQPVAERVHGGAGRWGHGAPQAGPWQEAGQPLRRRAQANPSAAHLRHARGAVGH